MTAGHRHIAVLTGDLVASTTLGEARIARAFAVLADCATQQEAWHGAPLRFTRHRGDGWQVALAKPALALRSALAFRAALRAEGEEFDSYIAIAVGPVSGKIGQNLNAENAGVFVRSGRNLDVLTGSDLPIRMACVEDGALNAAIVLADHISQGWTPPQAAAIGPFLTPGQDLSYTEVARTLGKSRQAVTKSLDAAGHSALVYALDSLEHGPEYA